MFGVIDSGPLVHFSLLVVQGSDIMPKWSRVCAASFLAFIMLATPILAAFDEVPVGQFPTDAVEVPILANEDIGLDDPSAVGWRTPIGWSGQEKLEKIIVYSDEGHAIAYGVDDKALEGGRGIDVVSTTYHTIPDGVDFMLTTQFLGDRLLAQAGDALHEIDLDDMSTVETQDLGFEPVWWSNLWNRWSVLNSRGELVYAMADEATLGLYARTPPWPNLGEYDDRTDYQTVSMGSPTISEPEVSS